MKLKDEINEGYPLNYYVLQNKLTPHKAREGTLTHCQNPGPATVGLPTLFGFDNHAFNKIRAPRYTMRIKHPITYRGCGPGPAGYNCQDMFRKGKYKIPTAICSPKAKNPPIFNTPSPDAYPRERCDPHIFEKFPAWTMRIKHPINYHQYAAGPADYDPYYVIAKKKVIQGWIKAEPQYTMRIAFHDWEKSPYIVRTPGPAAYHIPEPEVYKDKAPLWTMRIKHRDKDPFLKPGPGRYAPERHWFDSKRTSVPKYTFRIKHAELKHI